MLLLMGYFGILQVYAWGNLAENLSKFCLWCPVIAALSQGHKGTKGWNILFHHLWTLQFCVIFTDYSVRAKVKGTQEIKKKLCAQLSKGGRGGGGGGGHHLLFRKVWTEFLTWYIVCVLNSLMDCVKPVWVTLIVILCYSYRGTLFHVEGRL